VRLIDQHLILNGLTLHEHRIRLHTTNDIIDIETECEQPAIESEYLLEEETLHSPSHHQHHSSTILIPHRIDGLFIVSLPLLVVVLVSIPPYQDVAVAPVRLH